MFLFIAAILTLTPCTTNPYGYTYCTGAQISNNKASNTPDMNNLCSASAQVLKAPPGSCVLMNGKPVAP